MLTNNVPQKDAHALTTQKAATLKTGIHSFVDYFKKGASTTSDSKVGFELEQIIVDTSGYSVPYTGTPGAPGTQGCLTGKGCTITAILERLSPLYDKEIRADKNDPSSPLLGLSREDATITLEPGAQFEFSSQPFWQLQELIDSFEKYQTELTHITGDFNYLPLPIGYHPRTKVADITILPKERYNMMNEHFKSTGNHGMNMMRGTASTQVTIDYRDEADAIVKMRVAAALTPLFSLLTDNAPYFEGELVKDYMKRTTIWNDVDPDRSMIPPGLFTDGYDFNAYAETALTAPIILFDQGDEVSYAGQKGAVECYDIDTLALKDIEHILSMLFFDVRLRTYVEIRTADSMPFPYALAYVALIKGLFYDETNLRELSARFAHFTDDCVPAIKTALIRDGFEADVEAFYGESVQTMLRELIARTKEGLLRLSPDEVGAFEAAALDIFTPLIEGKTTLARELQK